MIRDPASVPYTFVNRADQLTDLADTLGAAANVAIDTEVPIDGPKQGQLRVMSIATRDPAGLERAFVVDARDVAPPSLGPLLQGVVADAWNANFDARVIDDAVFESIDTTHGLRWWDAQLADALLHQGRSGFTWYHGLAWATKHYLGIDAEGKGTTQLSYRAFDDLTREQIVYAASDAVETLWVADRLRVEIAEAELGRICEIEMAARPFLDQMERTGLPFDWSGWETELDKLQQQQRTVIGRIAELTGGGQGSLFDEVIEPSWNPASDPQVRRSLNTWAGDLVLAWTQQRFGRARPLTDTDSVTATVLREIGGELCDALLDYRNVAKILTTYGESIREHLDDDGRLRPQYLQVVGTNTGRLASRNPNAQNFTPKMKPFLRPPKPTRVFVHADLSQAELRYLAQVADDQPLREAFARGDDVHVATAATMFRFDAEGLQSTDPDRLSQLRQVAKALNFGIAYGQGAGALARSLTLSGTPTTKAEGQDLLAQYNRTYPGTAQWAKDRDAEVRALHAAVADFDWALTRRLADDFADIQAVQRSFRSLNRRWPDVDEIAELLHPGSPVTEKMLDHIGWITQYSAPVVLLRNGEPFTFSSRTIAGRRQQFNLHVDRLFLVAAIEAIHSPEPRFIAIRRRFEADNGLRLVRAGEILDDAELAKQFDHRPLRRAYMDAVENEMGPDVVVSLLNRAARDRISAMTNAWRNAPIQGGVADIMLQAYGDLNRRLRNFPTAHPVQTVHDSVVIECDEDDAADVAAAIRDALDASMLAFCPDVVPKADVDIRRSLASDDIITVL